MDLLYARDERLNDAINTHPPPSGIAQYLTPNGSNWLWAVFTLFALSWLAFIVLHKSARSGEKVFHYLFAIAAFVGLITYFAHASDLAWDVVSQANTGNDRQIFWAKYIFWAVAFPTIVILLGIVSGVAWATIIYNVLISWIWVISYLVGAYVETNYKWGFYAFGTVAYLWLAFNTLIRFRRFAGQGTAGHTVANNGNATYGHGSPVRDYTLLAIWSNILWLLYPLAWGISEGGDQIGVVGHFIWFGILDLLLIPGTGFVVLFLSRKWDYNAMRLDFTQRGRIHHGHHYIGKEGMQSHSFDSTAMPMNGENGRHHATTATAAPNMTAAPAGSVV